MKRKFDVLSMGRSLMDLYANEVGAAFPHVKNFAAYVGGCPTNISVGTRRLGLRTALLTAVGDDLVGDFVMNFLAQEGVVTGCSPRKPGRRTSAVMLAMESPDSFPLVAYRDNCADTELTIDDAHAAPIAESTVLVITGTGLTREPSRSATFYAAERARACGTKVFLDLDFRAAYWHDARAYAAAIRAALRLVDVVIGTADEVNIAASDGGGRTVLSAEVTGDSLRDRIEDMLTCGPEAVVMKRGAQSTFVYVRGGEIVEAAPFAVEVYNSLGAGDAFASGFIYGRLQGWDWYKAARIGNACGAIIVTRHGCANFMPYEHEVLNFIAEHGGF